jgi:hypothetical protein
MKLPVYDSFGIAASTMPMAQAARKRNNWHRRYLGVTTGRWRDFSKAAEVLMTDACAMIGINS